ncbi:MAG TPA: YtxH domain-containing protein [Candidatus Binatia bacterium]|nr:YtxH domain-containing protein [Candidatus Binatia bacterium]
MSTNNNDGSVSLFVIGVGLGLLAGLLWAPRPGAEMRRRIRRGADEGLDYLTAEADKLSANADQWVASSKSLVDQLRTWVGRARKRGETTFTESTQ